MKLVQLGRGVWTTYALCRADGSCQVIDFLLQLQSHRAHKALAQLQHMIPGTGPNHWARIELSKPLKGSENILEFRWPGRGGGTQRVLWFFDEGRVVICCCAIDKKGRMDRAVIRQAEEFRREYLAAKQAARIETISYRDYDCGDNG